MRSSRAALLMILATTLPAGCRDTTGVLDDTFLLASVSGAVAVEYSGTGTFMIRPEHSSGPRFSVSSTGRGATSNQGFAFLALTVPAPGSYSVGDPSVESIHATYWFDDEHGRRVFRARSGGLHVTESTAERTGTRLQGRIHGTFNFTAELILVCAVHAGFPAVLLDCAPAPAPHHIEVTGSFHAGPMGGEEPGLILPGFQGVAADK
jgi:hypothetical protein